MAVKSIETKAVISAEDRTGTAFSQIARKFKGLEQNAAAASRRMDSVASRMSAAGRAAQLQTMRSAYLASGMSSAAAPFLAGAGASKLAAINQKMAGVRAGVADFAKGALPGALAFGLGGAAIAGTAAAATTGLGLKSAISFDKAMADVRKKVSLDAGATFDDVEKMINKTSRATGIARADMAALAAQAGQSGIAFKDLSNFMMLAAKASSAWDVGAKEMSQDMAEIKAATGWTNKELEVFANKVNFMGDISAASEKNIKSMWAKVRSGAKESGLSYDDSMIAMTALKSVGMEEDVAARGFGQLVSRLRTAKSQNKKSQEALKELGLTPASVEAGMQEHGMATAMDVLQRLGKSKDAARIAVGLGGKEWWDEFLTMKSAVPEMERLQKAMASKGYEGSLDQSLKIDLATTENHMKRFGTLVNEIGDRLSRWALPGINASLENTIKLFDDIQSKGWFKTFFDNTKQGPQLGPNLGPDLGESAAISKQSTLSASPLWSKFMENSRPQLSMNLGPELGESVVPKSAMTGFPSIPSGADKFGFGTGGVGEIWNKFGPLSRGPHAQIKAEAELKGAADVTVKVEVQTDKDSVVKEVTQQMQASGNMRSDVGTTMPMGQ